MFARHSLQALLPTLFLALALTATTAARAGETTPESASAVSANGVPTVTVTAQPITSECDRLSADEARKVAVHAQQEGEHRKAADCYRIAGDLVRADRAQLKASAETAAESSQKSAANVQVAKEQARRLREAFHR
jgi:hypothetical protein